MKLIYFKCLRGGGTLFMIIKKANATKVKTDDRKKYTRIGLKHIRKLIQRNYMQKTCFTSLFFLNIAFEYNEHIIGLSGQKHSCLCMTTNCLHKLHTESWYTHDDMCSCALKQDKKIKIIGNQIFPLFLLRLFQMTSILIW